MIKELKKQTNTVVEADNIKPKAVKKLKHEQKRCTCEMMLKSNVEIRSDI